MHALQQGPHPRLQAVRLHPAWPVSASVSLADYLSTCQSLTPLRSGRRSKVNQYENKSLIKIEHVNDKVDTDFYMGKRYAPAPPILNSSRPSSQVSRWMTAHRSKRAAAAALVGSARAALARGCGTNPWLPRTTASDRYCVDPPRSLDAPWMFTVAATYAGRTCRRSGCRHGAEEGGGGHLTADGGAGVSLAPGRVAARLGTARQPTWNTTGWSPGAALLGAEVSSAVAGNRAHCFLWMHPLMPPTLFWQGGVRVQG